MQAACGLAQLDKAQGFIDKRKQNFALLSELLKECEDVLILPQATPNSDPSWFGFPITIRPESGIDRVKLTQYLDEHKIGTRLLFAGNLTKQPYMAGQNFRIHGELKNTDIAMNHTFWVGVQPSLNDSIIGYVADTIKKFL